MDIFCKYYKQKEQVSYDGYFIHHYNGYAPHGTSTYRYSTDGIIWNEFSLETPIRFYTGQKIKFTAIGSEFVGNLSFSGRGSIEGNILSVCYGSNFTGQTIANPDIDEAFYGAFGGDIEYAHNLILPSNDPNGNAYYSHMFSGCQKLKTAPVLPAKKLSQNCYSRMFVGCYSLSAITCLATDISASGCTNEWIGERLGGGGQDVAENGIFVKDANMTNWTTGGLNGIPSGWVVSNYSLSSRTLSGTPYCVGCNRYIDVFLQTSSDSGKTWITTNKTQVLIEENSYICPCSYKYKIRYMYGEPETATCDSTSAITENEIAKGNLVDVQIGECVTTIGNNAFIDYMTLTYLTISNSVTTIGTQAFDYCVELLNITIPSGVTTIGNYAFSHCSSAKSVTIGNGVTSIGQGAFSNCSGLTSITCLATTPPSLGYYAFDNTNNCPIYVPCESVIDYKTEWYDYVNRIHGIPPCSEPILNLKWLATYSDAHIESAECDSSSSITENELTKTGIVDVQIGECVTTIGEYALAWCENLSGLTIPNSVTTFGNYALLGCSSITSVNIPSGVTRVNKGAFEGCSSLSSITIPSGVTYIGEFAFSDNDSLTNVEIPSRVTEIGRQAFSHCTSLASITCLATTPPTLRSDAFYNTNNCPIYVPSGSVSAYKSVWSDYASRIQAIP